MVQIPDQKLLKEYEIGDNKMNKLTADHALDVADLLSPINQPMADVQASEVTDLLYQTFSDPIEQGANNSEPTPKLLGFLSDLTNGSYNAWLARGGAANAVE